MASNCYNQRLDAFRKRSIDLVNKVHNKSAHISEPDYPYTSGCSLHSSLLWVIFYPASLSQTPQVLPLVQPVGGRFIGD